MSDKREIVLNIVKSEYDGCGISDEDLARLADDIYDEIFVERYELTEIMILVSEFEDELGESGVEIDFGKSDIIFDDILCELDCNAENAKRLYDCFFEYDSAVVFQMLMTDFRELLTKEQVDKVISSAKQTFDKSIWEDYID